MEKGAMEGGREWCSLTWARGRPCLIHWPFVFVGGCSHSLVGIRIRWWAFAFTGGHSLSLVGIRFRWWGVVWCGGKPLVAGRVLPFVGIRLRWWAVVSVRARLASLVAVRDVVAGGVVVR